MYTKGNILICLQQMYTMITVTNRLLGLCSTNKTTRRCSGAFVAWWYPSPQECALTTTPSTTTCITPLPPAPTPVTVTTSTLMAHHNIHQHPTYRLALIMIGPYLIQRTCNHVQQWINVNKIIAIRAKWACWGEFTPNQNGAKPKTNIRQNLTTVRNLGPACRIVWLPKFVRRDSVTDIIFYIIIIKDYQYYIQFASTPTCNNHWIGLAMHSQKSIHHCV